MRFLAIFRRSPRFTVRPPGERIGLLRTISGVAQPEGRPCCQRPKGLPGAPAPGDGWSGYDSRNTRRAAAHAGISLKPAFRRSGGRKRSAKAGRAGGTEGTRKRAEYPLVLQPIRLHYSREISMLMVPAPPINNAFMRESSFYSMARFIFSSAVSSAILPWA